MSHTTANKNMVDIKMVDEHLLHLSSTYQAEIKDYTDLPDCMINLICGLIDESKPFECNICNKNFVIDWSSMQYNVYDVQELDDDVPELENVPELEKMYQS